MGDDKVYFRDEVAACDPETKWILADIADERVREARREVWEAAWLLLHETVIPAGEPRSFIEKDRRRLVAAFNKARAAEGEGE